jgi:ubiquinone/menaquinone biosynthesis C-methylase UbiE
MNMEITSSSMPARRMAAQFDLVAPIYPTLERLVFGAHLNNARQAFVENIIEADRVLLVGEGNGRFLKSLIARKQSGFIKVVEKSRAMIRSAKTRAGESRNVGLEFIEADFRLCQPGKQFDCVVTHFFLDQFNPPAQLAIIEKFAKLITRDGIWINVDFVPARTLRGGVLMWSQYAFFRLVSQIEARRCFDESAAAAAAGWTVAETISYISGLIVAKRYQRAPVPAAGQNTPNPAP